ncbi:MAG: hypothetical protein FWF46_02850 [Oscillospiraceae bacterium]|nr:hypothetical protein [Oscillospiraceae bacterium]
MNQILSMNQQNPNFGSNYNNQNTGGGNGKTPMDLKTVKRIFGVLLLIFGLALFIGGIMGLLSKSSQSATRKWACD